MAYRFLAASRTRRAWRRRLPRVFLFASVAPVYFVWLAPELFNFSLVLYAFFLCVYKRAPGQRR